MNCGMVARQKTPAFGLSKSVVSPVTRPRHSGTAERPGPAADDSFADVADSGPAVQGPILPNVAPIPPPGRGAPERA